MITYIRLTNFKSFSSISIDLRGSHGIPKKLALIYGENGAGKSNLILSILFLMQTMDTLTNQMHKNFSVNQITSLQDDEIKQKLLDLAIQERNSSLSDIIHNYWSIGNEKPMEIELGFRLNNHDGHYFASFSKQGIIKEELYGTLKEKAGILFSISQDKSFLSPSCFVTTKYKKELEEEIDKYWGKHTLMSILTYEQTRTNIPYIKNALSPVLLSIKKALQGINILCKVHYGETGRSIVLFQFLNNLEEGFTKAKDNRELLACEDMLNQYFTKLYADIKAVHYHFSKAKEGFHYTLYFDKLISGKICSVPVTMESTGTKKILEIFPLLFSYAAGQTVLVDEIDSGIHDLLMVQIMQMLLDLPAENRGQLIVSTHNTLLLDAVPPENVYVIRADANGNKKITCITEYKFRTQKNNSMRVKYLHGFYEGVPESGDLDFEELVTDTYKRIAQGEKGKVLHTEKGHNNE
ncbi:MAG: AAA family ATPase [Spirochaetia bacterium]|jgi:AAA15 family ATPase/GTPase|nr:AAA family ATPase [Spirochaetia bacterium]